ncbi:MAG: hypothetical protein ACOYT4_00070 [Nanoarchaeota archaeon]
MNNKLLVGATLAGLLFISPNINAQTKYENISNEEKVDKKSQLIGKICRINEGYHDNLGQITARESIKITIEAYVLSSVPYNCDLQEERKLERKVMQEIYDELISSGKYKLKKFSEDAINDTAKEYDCSPKD